jgi:parallel beta-helix repeat protein
MTARVCFLLASVLISLTLSLPARAQTEYFVSPAGNDSWSGYFDSPNAGRTDGPFATIGRAQRAARAAAKPARVRIRAGTYVLDQPLAFAPEDSETLYAAYKGERPLISGGVRIANFKKADNGWWTADLPEVRDGKWNFIQLFVNGQRRYRPRLPKGNKSFSVAEALAPTEANKTKGFDRLKFSGDQIKPDWHNLGDVEVLATQNWTMARMRIASVDGASQVVNFTGHTSSAQPYSSFKKDWPFLVENVREALGEPGEWYLDRKTGVLTYIPMPGEEIDKAEVIAPRLETFLSVRGDAAAKKYVEHLEFDGLTFAHTNWTTPPEGNNFSQAEVNLGGAVTFDHARDCTFGGCGVRNVGTYAIDIADDCKRVKVTGCVLSDLGAGGVKVGLTRYVADEQTVTSHNAIEGNLITQGGRLHPAAIGVWVGHSSHNVISRNEISDFYYTAISVGWSWGYAPAGAHHNTIAYNHVHTIGQGVLSDMGGIYTLGLSDGTVIDHNLFHDIVSYDYGGWGIYFDEGTTHITAENNIVYNTKTGGFHQHYGKENTVRNNIFAYSTHDQLQRSRQEPHQSFAFERNIVYWKQGNLLGSYWADTDKYAFDHNLYWRTDGKPVLFSLRGANFKAADLTFEQWQAKGQDKNSLIADPMLIDPEKGDFELKRGSPAERIGFVPIDLNRAGPSAEVLARRPKPAGSAFPTGAGR